jgi:hypothetical protein
MPNMIDQSSPAFNRFSRTPKVKIGATISTGGVATVAANALDPYQNGDICRVVDAVDGTKYTGQMTAPVDALYFITKLSSTTAQLSRVDTGAAAAVSELASELARDEDGNPLVEDADIRHKAAVQLLKWTVGNNSIAPASAEQQPAPLQVIIGTGLSQTTSIDGEAEDDPEDVRECLECHLVKPAKDFVGDSNRCQACHQKLLDSVRERYGADALGSVHASEEPSSA